MAATTIFVVGAVVTALVSAYVVLLALAARTDDERT